MAIESAADIVQILANELKRIGTNAQEFAAMTGIAEERLELLHADEWDQLTVREIVAISETLEVDLWDL